VCEFSVIDPDCTE